MYFLNIAILLICIVGFTLMYHKIRRIHLSTFNLIEAAKDNAHTYQQVQAYHDLMILIQPTFPLPLLRGWAASPDFLLQISLYASKHKPERILECSSGASTIVLARCCQINNIGHVYSLEHDEHFANQTRERLEEQGLSDFATVLHAPLKPVGNNRQPWYDLADIDTQNGFDMVVIDGPPNNLATLARYPALPQLDKFVNSGAHIFLDDAARNSETETLRLWATEFPNYKQYKLFLEKGGAELIKTELLK